MAGWPMSHPTLSLAPEGRLAPVLAWHLDTFELEATAGRLFQHGLPVPKAGTMSEAPGLASKAPMLLSTSVSCTSPMHCPSLTPGSAWKSYWQ